MQCGFSKAEAIDLFNSLSVEVYDFFGNPHPIPQFHIDDNARPRAIAETWFSDYNDFFSFRPTPYARHISFSQIFLDYMYEDEIIIAILHELAHSVLPFSAGHGPIFAKTAEMLGSIGESSFYIRKHRDINFDIFGGRLPNEQPTLSNPIFRALPV